MGSVRKSISGRCLRWLVRATETVLRRVHAVTEFEREALFLIELGRAECVVDLSDGCHIRPGDAVMELHLWNEQLPRLGFNGTDFGWATRIRRQILLSLHRLALHIQADPSLHAVRALRMKPAIPSRRSANVLAKLLLKVGFEPVAGAADRRGYLLRFLDNVWLWLLAWAHNPQALKGWRFNRTRREFWISRRRFIALYAEGPAPATNGERLGRSQGAVVAPRTSATLGGPRTWK